MPGNSIVKGLVVQRCSNGRLRKHRAISALSNMLGRPRTRKRHDRQWRLAEFRDGYFFNQRVEDLVDASARFICAAEAVLCALQKLARRGEITSHDNTRWFGPPRGIVGALN
ncbi:hypothetical protein [Mesorhizobium sp. M0684]|uniref:hypothetical protein n=1 Tax=unclassified Mesorhizobium TaxID=325217 RepID=UPI00333BF179